MSAAYAPLHFDLGLSPAANTVIESVAAARKITPSAVLARAIALIKIEEDARVAGQTLAVLDADKKPVGELEVV